MVTARDEEMDRVVGLEIGADDYITKPFSMRELVARVKAHLRHDRLLRNELGGQAALPVPEVLQFDGLEIDLSRREVRLNQRVIALKPKEYELLLYLARHRRQVIGRETLLERVWGWEYSGNSRTVDVHVRWLREKIETEPASPTRIVTVRGSGYRFEG
jgi:DNA-binding response OmpR family regulator